MQRFEYDLLPEDFVRVKNSPFIGMGKRISRFIVPYYIFEIPSGQENRFSIRFLNSEGSFWGGVEEELTVRSPEFLKRTTAIISRSWDLTLGHVKTKLYPIVSSLSFIDTSGRVQTDKYLHAVNERRDNINSILKTIGYPSKIVIINKSKDIDLKDNILDKIDSVLDYIGDY